MGLRRRRVTEEWYDEEEYIAGDEPDYIEKLREQTGLISSDEYNERIKKFLWG
jgi:hypothetical protein